MCGKGEIVDAITNAVSKDHGKGDRNGKEIEGDSFFC